MLAINLLSTFNIDELFEMCDKAKIVVKEMMDSLALDLVNKGLVTNYISLSIGYDIDNLKNDEIMKEYQGDVVLDYMGRNVPKGSHGSIRLESFTYSSKDRGSLLRESPPL